MGNTLPPENLGLLLVLVALICGGFAIQRLVLWVRSLPVTPDPWSADVEKDLESPDARPICRKCIKPQPPGQWFCEHCGTSVGDYNNLMPYVSAFSQGEVMRNGVMDRLPKNALVLVGYLLISLNLPAYFIILIPFFWYFLLKNLNRKPEMEFTKEAHGNNPP